MAQNATVFKAHLQIADIDRHHYADYSHTLARHPSETDLRMMVRLLAFMLRADERLEFTRGLCVDDEPDLWRKSYSDEIELWIDTGLPSEKRIRKACNRSKQVLLLVYGTDQAVNPWWSGLQGQIGRFDNLEVLRIPPEQSDALAALAERGMHLNCTIQDGQVWISGDHSEVTIEPKVWLPAL